MHTYTPEEISPLTDVNDIHNRALTHGYTNPSISHINDANGEKYTVTIDEADDKATVKTNLVAADPPTLSVDVSDLQVAGNAVDDGDITITDSRGAAAENEEVTVTPSQAMALSDLTLTLDASGQAVLTFGPSSSTGIKSPKMPLSLSNGLSDPIQATCQYT